MAKVTAKDIIKCEVPPNLNQSLVVRCTDVEFGESKSSGQPMITSKWEIVGVRNKDNGVDDHLIVDDKKFVISGLATRPVYHSLGAKAIGRHQDFWSKANGKSLEEYEVDTENPDTSYYKGLVMSAVVVAEVQERTQKLSEDEKEALKAEGKPLVGKPVLDDEGKPLPPYISAKIDSFNRRFSGNLPQF